MPILILSDAVLRLFSNTHVVHMHSVYTAFGTLYKCTYFLLTCLLTYIPTYG